MTEVITIYGWSIERTSIEIDAEAYEAAKGDDSLDHELDVYLSDMDGDTFVIEPSGKVMAPYDSPAERTPEWVLERLKPLLDRLPRRILDHYVMTREAK